MLLIIFLLCLIFASKCTISCFFFFNDTATTEIYTLSLHDALPISGVFESTTDVVFSGHLIISENGKILCENNRFQRENEVDRKSTRLNSSHANISYAVFCLKKKQKYKMLDTN